MGTSSGSHMVKRDFDAAFINSVINDPAVRGGAKVIEDVDLSEFIKDTNNIVLTYEYGGFVLIKRDDSYELHTQALKKGRGKMLRDALKEMFTYMFARCDKITSMTCLDNPASTALSRKFMTEVDKDNEYYYFVKEAPCQ